MNLFEYLKMNYPNKSKNNLKSLLKDEKILVNDKIITKYDYEVKKEDKIKIMNTKISNDIKIEYEDKYIIVVIKPHNLLTISNEKEKEKTLFHIVSNYLKLNNKNNKIFVVHRLDYETSGLVIFAKDEKTKKILQNNWNDVVRNYIVIVEGKTKNKDIIKLKLLEKGYNVYVDPKGKDSITEYQLLKNNNKYSMLKVNIKTGRKNQIRVALKEKGFPIIGDSKYGKKEKIMYLIANELEFIHPITKKKIIINYEIPDYFKKRFDS